MIILLRTSTPFDLRFRPAESFTQTCQVCLDQQSLTMFRPLSHHQQCHQSPRSICDVCVYQHIQQTFQSLLTDTLNCPELACQLPFDYHTIRAILLLNNNHKLLERYDRFTIHHQLEQMDEFIWCSNVKCQMGQFNEGGEANNIVTCRSCRHKTCFTHKTPWHAGLTCQEHDLTIGGELKASLHWLHQNTKTCPKCSSQIEKNDGCDHMTCIKCQHEFCWCCLAAYARIREDGNHRHHPHCKHYAAYDDED